MSQLGEWLFQQQQKRISEAVERNTARTAVVATSDASGITVTDPLTGVAESEIAIPLGFRVPVGSRALLMRLGDGSQVAMPFGQVATLIRRGMLAIQDDDAQAFEVDTDSGSARFSVDTIANNVELWNGTDLVLRPGGNPAVESGRIDGATGKITGLFFAGINQRGSYVNVVYDGTPTTATNASISAYVEHAATSFTLTEGTWQVSAISFANYKNNTATRGARSRTLINGAAGSSVADTNAAANELMTLTSSHEVSALPFGTFTIKTEYYAEDGGTASARDVTWLMFAERTA